MITRPYADLLAEVNALAGASLATQENARVKIFINRRARKAYRECDHWPRWLKIGEERLVSSDGLLPLTETGKSEIDMILRIHATKPWGGYADCNAAEYFNFNVDSDGCQIVGYYPTASSYGSGMLVSNTGSPNYDGLYVPTGSTNFPFSTDGESSWTSGTWGYFGYSVSLGWSLGQQTSQFFFDIGWKGFDEPSVASPADVTIWTAQGGVNGAPTVTEVSAYSAFITYIAALPDTYGDGAGEDTDVPEEWFEYLAQGAYCDWLRSDGRTEKAMAEEAYAAELLNQQLEKISKQGGQQVITRVLTHGNTQCR